AFGARQKNSAIPTVAFSPKAAVGSGYNRALDSCCILAALAAAHVNDYAGYSRKLSKRTAALAGKILIETRHSVPAGKQLDSRIAIIYLDLTRNYERNRFQAGLKLVLLGVNSIF